MMNYGTKMTRELYYQNLKILEADFISIQHLESVERDYDIIKVFISPQNKDGISLNKNGYFFADRTLDVCIPLSKMDNVDKLIRLPIIKTNEYKKDIIKIAQKSFLYDRRFHLQRNYNQKFANVIIEDWINKIDDIYVCLYKNSPIGFLSLIYLDDKNSFIHLAAVEEKYRMTGAAISLYAKAIQVSLEKNYTNVNGRISSCNIAAVNLYSYFGAKFSNPIDIYIKDKNEFRSI